jgi:hypothetical protein
MLTSFFGKSSPINYLILAVFIFLAYVLEVLTNTELVFSFAALPKHLLIIAGSVFTMLLLDFIIRKNNLNRNNTYGIFFLSCFLVAIPEIFLESDILIANILILLALRRVLSFRNNKNIEKKILDATIWIVMASFFYFWSLLFFFLLYAGLMRKAETNYKQLLIPVTGFLGMLVLATAYYFLVSSSFDWFYTWKSPIGFDFSAYNKGNLLFPATVFLAFLVWTGMSRFFKIASTQKKDRPNAVLLLISLLTTVFIALASPQKTGAEMLFILGPLTIISTNYVENIDEFWFKETLLWLAVLLPVIVFVL